MRLPKYALVTLFIFISLPTLAQTNSFQLGVKAFRQQDFNAALNHFLAAKKEGHGGPQLTYNLGSTYFKLARYQQSEAQFRQLVSDPKWQGLALYNLGLIAEKSDNPILAQHYYVQALQRSDNPTLAKLATTRLNRIDDNASEDKTAFSLSVLAGNDDNAIAFADELQASSSAVSDSFYDIYAFGQLSLADNPRTDNYLQGFFYNKSYQDFSSLDVNILSFSFFQDFHNSSVNRGITLMSSNVDGTTAYRQVQLHISTRPSILNGRWTATYEPSYFAGGSEYQHLDGWQHRVSAARYWRHNSAALGLTLFGEINKRDDLTLGTSRYSYSPTRVGVDLLWRWNQSARLTYILRGVYTHSQYSGNSRFEDLDGVIKDKERKADKMRLSGEVNYLLDRDWILVGKLEHTNNDENFEYYTYERNQLVVGATYRF